MDVLRAVSLAMLLACGLGCGEQKSKKPPPTAASGVDARTEIEHGEVIDRTAETTAILTLWNAPDGLDRLHAAAHPSFQKAVSLDELRIFHDDFVAKAGAFVAVTSSQGVEHTRSDGIEEDVVRGLVKFEHGEAPYELVLSEHQGKKAMVNFKMELPPALKVPPDRDAARALAAELNAALLAANLPAIDAISLPRIRGQLTPDDIPRFRAAVAALGAQPKVETTSDESCGDVVHCMRFTVTGKGGSAKIEQTLSAPFGRWRVVNWKFEPEEKKP